MLFRYTPYLLPLILSALFSIALALVAESRRRTTGAAAFGLGLEVSRLRDRSGNRVGILNMTRDLTARKRAQDALRASGQYARSIIDSSLDMIITTDNERRIVEFNDAAQNAFGYTRAEILGHHIDQLYADPRDGEIIRRGLLQDGKFMGEVLNRRKNGETFTSLLTASILRGAQGEVLGVVGVSRDITDWKRTEAARRSAEEKYRTIFDHAVEGIFQSTPDGRFINVNPALARMWGYASPQELVSSIGDIAHQVYADPARRADFRRLMEEVGEVRGFEFQARRTDGSLMWVSENARAVRAADGTVLYYEGTTEDITARKRAEDALRESEERFSGAFEQAAIGMALVAPDGRWLRVNHALCDLTGYSESELLSKTFQDITHPDDLETDLAFVRQMLAGEARNYQMEKRYFHKAGHVVWILLSVSLVRDAQGQPLHFIAQIQNITARKQAEAALQRRADEFAALYDITHDLAVQQDLPTLLRTIVDRATTLLSAPAGGIYLYDAARRDLSMVAPKGTGFTVGLVMQLGEGLAGRVALTRQPMIVDDYGQWEYRSPQFAGIPITAVVAVPMLYGGDLIGVLAVHEETTTARQFTESDARLLSLFAGQAASAVHGARLLGETQHRAQQQEALYHISTRLTRMRETQEVCETVIREGRNLLGYPFLGIFLLDPDTGDRVLQAQRGWEDAPSNWRLHPGEGVSEKAILTGTLQYWRDVAQEPRYVAGKAGYHSELDVPIKASESVLGVLIAEDPRVDAFDQGDFEVLQAMANQLAIALENTRLYAEQRHLSITDSLTGVFNRRHFMDLAQREFQRAQRLNSPCAVLMLDLDGLKYVNDTFGHSAGDEALRLVAKTLAKNVRSIDVVARYGGDEFVILLPDCHPPEAQQIAARLQRVSKTLSVASEDRTIELSFSLGAAVAALTPEETLNNLLDRADAEMYQIKRKRKNLAIAT